MAVKEPNTGVVGLESDHKIAIWIDEESVSPHGCGWERNIVGIEACIIFRTSNGLESVSVEMERVLPAIIVIENDIHDLIFLEDERMLVFAIDLWISGKIPGSENCV